MIFQTHNSEYEIDFEKNRARRVYGIHEPTPRMGDNVWREYERIEPDVPMLNYPVLFIWNTTDEGVLQGTITTPILDMAEA